VPEYIDDDKIHESEVLYRRVKLRVDLITFDPGCLRLRPTSTAFQNTTKELQAGDGLGVERVETYMSVFLHTALENLELTHHAVLEGVEEFVLVRLTAGEVRRKGIARSAEQAVFLAPETTPPECMAAHGGVSGKKTKGLRKDLSDIAVWVTRPSLEWVLENRSLLRIPDDFALKDNFEILFA
jgi:hypothetical protein